MVVVLADITQKGGDGIHVVEDSIDVTVVEQVPESRAPSGNHVSQSTACCRRHFLKFCCIQISEKLWPLRPSRSPVALVHPRIHVAIRDENIQQSVVIKVDESGSPSEKRNGWTAQACPECDFGKTGITIIPEKRVVIVGKYCHIKVDFAVAIVVTHCNPHGCLRQPIVGESEAGQVTHVFKGTVVKITVEITRDRIVCHGQVEPTVTVEVARADRRHPRPQTPRPDRNSSAGRRRPPSGSHL